MELFREDGCLSDEGLHALTAGQLDELGRLEAAEHLAYCDKCTDRYTALLTADALADPVYSAQVMAGIPAGFAGEAKDCAGAALLLCSEEGRYITGIDLTVDGGMKL